jgi:hypothetical protein
MGGEKNAGSGGGNEVTGKVCAGDTSEWSFPRWIVSLLTVIILIIYKSINQ